MLTFLEFLEEGKLNLLKKVFNTREIVQAIKDKGWELSRTSGGHDIYTHTEMPGSIPIARHTGDVDKGTAHSILTTAGIKKPKETTGISQTETPVVDVGP
jgi:predicted RNA binding protein YcfA (HicA-like mRNA interferase family)